MVLAEHGRPQAPILIAPDASAVEAFAAEQMQDYLGRIAGCAFVLLRSAGAPEGPSIIVTRAASELGRKVCPVDGPSDPESYLIEVVGDQLRVIGADDRATLYGVYAFLEEDCGVRFLAPGVANEIVPRRPRLAVPGRRRSDRPAWPVRMLAPLPKRLDNAELFKNFIDFAAKVRLNSVMLFAGSFNRCSGTQNAEPWDDVRAQLLPEFQKRGIWLDVGHHSWDFFVDPADHFAEHPEWFSLVGGRRVATRQLCLATEAVMQEFERNVRAYLRAHPEISVLSLFPNDVAGASFCECDHCRNLGVERAALGVVNRIAAALAKEFPRTRFAHLTYSAWGAQSPAAVRPEPNVILYWAAWSRCMGHGYYDPDCATNGPFQASLEGWRRNWPNEIIIYDYYTTTNHSTNALVPYGRAMAEDARELRRRGFDGLETIFSQVENWWTYALNLWLFGRLTWNPERDPDELIEEWVSAAYPSTTGRITSVYQMLAEAGRRHSQYFRSDIILRLLSGDFETDGTDEIDHVLRVLEECSDLVLAARAARGARLETDYLRRLAIVIRYGMLRCRYVRAIIGALAALKEAGRLDRVAERKNALRRGRRCLTEMAAAGDEVMALLTDLGKDVEGVLHPVYVETWAKPTPELGLKYEVRRVLESRFNDVETAATD